MGAPLINLVPIKSQYEQDVKEVLQDAISQGFEAVAVVGYRDGHSWIKSSKLVSRHAFIGALEDIKSKVLSQP